jgi:hypothetical protein
MTFSPLVEILPDTDQFPVAFATPITPKKSTSTNTP